MLSMLVMIIICVIMVILMSNDVLPEEVGGFFVSILILVILLISVVATVNYFETTHMDEEKRVILNVMDGYTTGDLTDSPIIEEIVDFNQELVEYQSMHENKWWNFGISKKVMDVTTITNYENGGE